jgi:hypothetical protein
LSFVCFEDSLIRIRKKCPDRKNIRDKFKKDLYKHLPVVNTNTNTTLTRVISSTINAWLNNAPLPKLLDLAPDASTTLKKAYAFQQNIGWENFFKGRWDIAWGEMYNYEKTRHNSFDISRPMDAETWGSKLLDLIWSFVIDMWLARNLSEHNLDNKGTDISKRKIIEQLTWVRDKIPANISHPYKAINQDKLMKLPVSNLSIMCDQLLTIYEKHRLNSDKFEVT